MLKGEGTPDEVVRKHGYKIVEDNGAIEAAVDAAFEANPDVVERLEKRQHEADGCHSSAAVTKATRGEADAKGCHQGRDGQDQGLTPHGFAGIPRP